MRIIGGEASGRTIASPRGQNVRPTPDRIREALFNILRSLRGISFLDLFAGTGSVGLEALSRGADRVTFVEKNPRMAFQINGMLKALDFEPRGEVLNLDVRSGTARLSGNRRRYDIVFADPPYDKGMISKTVQDCLAPGLLADEGLLVLQHSLREPLDDPEGQEPLKLIQERRYGDTLVSFLQFHNKEH